MKFIIPYFICFSSIKTSSTDAFLSAINPNNVSCNFFLSFSEKYFNPKGILFHDEINLNDLNESLYNDMMPYLEENYQRACELKVADDYMVENYFSKTNIL